MNIGKQTAEGRPGDLAAHVEARTTAPAATLGVVLGAGPFADCGRNRGRHRPGGNRWHGELLQSVGLPVPTW